MSEEGHAEEGKVVESQMSAEQLAYLSDPRPTEGEVPESTKEFGTIAFEEVEASCKEADEKADDREDIPTGEASEEE